MVGVTPHPTPCTQGRKHALSTDLGVHKGHARSTDLGVHEVRSSRQPGRGSPTCLDAAGCVLHLGGALTFCLHLLTSKLDSGVLIPTPPLTTHVTQCVREP